VFDRSWAFKDVLTGQAPNVWRGGKGQFEFGFFIGHNATTKVLTDLKATGGLGAITFALRGPYNGTPSGKLSDIVFSKTVLIAEFNSGLVIDDWNSKASDKAHLIIPFTDDEMSLDELGADTNYWAVISAVSDDDPTEEVPIAGTTLKMLEDGVIDGNAPRQKIVVPSDTNGGKSYQMMARFENGDVNIIYPGNAITSGGPYRSVIVQDDDAHTWHRVLNRIENNIPIFYADPIPLVGIDSFPKILVRNVTDWEFYQLKLRTEDNIKELYLSEDPI